MVFAASSLTDAFREIAARFESDNPEVNVVLNFAGSQKLRTQLEHGAKADVFASADMRQTDAVTEAGLTRGEPTVFAINRLALINSRHASKKIALDELARPGIKLVVAQPAVPAGAYARQVLQNLDSKDGFGPGFAARVLANLVSEEPSVRSVAQKVALGDADAGLVYQSDALSADIAPRVEVVAIPEDCNIAAEYPAVALADARQPETARQFIGFLLSPQGQGILERHGFTPVSDSAAVPANVPGNP